MLINYLAKRQKHFGFNNKQSHRMIGRMMLIINNIIRNNNKHEYHSRAILMNDSLNEAHFN